MNRAEKERRERQQRMLAREQGLPPPESTVQTKKTGGKPAVPPKARRAAPRTGAQSNARPLSPILRRRQRRRKLVLAALVIAAALFVAGVTGLLGAGAQLLRDWTDSVYLYIDRSGGTWPANTGIQNPLRVEELAGGFVELGSEDVAVYSAYGSKVRTVQHGYARPALAVGNTRFVVYNRAGTEFRVQSRTANLYTGTAENGILLCAMSGNGSLAVVTGADRYAAAVQIYDASYRKVYSWSLTQSDGTPVALDFAGDNRRFAAGTISAHNGQLHTTVYFMNITNSGVTASYTADTGSLILGLHWLGVNRVLAVLDGYAALLDAETGAELARLDYGGAAIEDYAVGGKAVALLLAGRGENTLTVLDHTLQTLGTASVGGAASVSCTDTQLYLIEGYAVSGYNFDATMNWEQTLTARPLAVLDAAETLIFSGTTAAVLDG